LQGDVLGHEWRHCTKEISNPFMEQRDRRFGENTLREGNLVGESETPILGELNPPKDSKIPRRNQEITKGGLGVTFTIELERERVKRSEVVRRGNSVRV
jgi:hypothetical protein